MGSSDRTYQKPGRYGVVDMGSNAIRTQIVEIDPPGTEPRTVHQERVSVRLGQDVFLAGAIPESAIEAAVAAMIRFKQLCDEHQVRHIRAIATSATREANNRDVFLERIEAATGIKVEVISGSEEAWLLSVAVRRKLDMSKGKSMLVDLGGGSVEVTLVEDGQVVSAESYPLGALRLMQALSAAGETEQRGPFLDLLDQYVNSLEGRLRDRFGKGAIQRYVATGGNIETLADLIQKEGKAVKISGLDALPLATLSDWTKKLAVLSHADRMRSFDLRSDRADTILPAAVVYYRLGKAAKVDTVIVPRTGLRDGLLSEVAAGHLWAFRAIDHRETVLSACAALGRKYQLDEQHAARTRELSLQLFDQTRELHGLDAEDRILLECAALLHDVGAYVSNQRHHKHSYYLIRESDLVGLSEEEREIVALVARYHRRAHPDRTHEEIAKLPRKDRVRVARLAALLRVGDALDREHLAKVKALKAKVGKRAVELTLELAPEGPRSIALESWSVEQKGRMFLEVFGLEIHVAR